MKIRRNTGGYTLLELTMVVAILGILMSLSAIGIRRHQRTLTQVEYDGIAREIFVAAQNHLTMAESQGLIDIPDKTNPLEVGFPYDADEGIYYYVVNDTLRNELKELGKLNMLDLMLPAASVDGTARLGGSYVILYQMEPAVVLDVFYASAKDGRFHHMFDSGEVESADLIMSYSGVQNYQSRQYYQYTNESNNEGATTVIGWYGVRAGSGDSIISGDLQPPVPEGEHLNPPIIRVVNAERLYVDVNNPNKGINNAELRLVVTGKWSEEIKEIPLIDKDGNIIDTRFIDENYGDDRIHLRVVLDDVTSANKQEHFHNACPNLFPGEDISVYVVAYNNVELTNIATSASVTTNSLFASLDKGDPDNDLPSSLNPSEVYTAKISNFRHLENLDDKISKIPVVQPPDKVSVTVKIDDVEHRIEKELSYYVLGEDEEHTITCAEQISDMDWVTFWDKLPGGRKTVYDYNGHAVTDNQHYFPITNGGKIEYKGAIKRNKAPKISNVKISVSGANEPAGLFATLGNDSAAKDLELLNFSVEAKNGAAGALAGVLQDDSTVCGVLAHHDSNKSGNDYAIEGKTSVGGLIGQITGARTVRQNAVEQCAAALYVKSDEDAGGLIGRINNIEAVTLPVSISDSYAGGHVIDDEERGVKYDETQYNVDAKKSAGGLIGSGAGNLRVENCYATASVKGETAGGLIGSVAGGEISNCYVTGLIAGSGSGKGAFVGEPGAASFTNDRYLSIINDELPAVGDGRESAIAAFDDTVERYAVYAPCTGGAEPYNDTLRRYYNGKYMFMTISQLHSQGENAPGWMETHYGDWPSPETIVVNVRDE